MYYKRRRYRRKSYRGKRIISIGEAARMEEAAERKKRVVVVDSEDMLAGCWEADSRYMSFHGDKIHQTYAAGEGPLVRHLCCDSRCINPMHLLRGTAHENTRDEVDMRDLYLMKYPDHRWMVTKWDMLPEYKEYTKGFTLKLLDMSPMYPIVKVQLKAAQILMIELMSDSNIKIVWR